MTLDPGPWGWWRPTGWVQEQRADLTLDLPLPIYVSIGAGRPDGGQNLSFNAKPHNLLPNIHLWVDPDLRSFDDLTVVLPSVSGTYGYGVPPTTRLPLLDLAPGQSAQAATKTTDFDLDYDLDIARHANDEWTLSLRVSEADRNPERYPAGRIDLGFIPSISAPSTIEYGWNLDCYERHFEGQLALSRIGEPEGDCTPEGPLTDEERSRLNGPDGARITPPRDDQSVWSRVRLPDRP